MTLRSAFALAALLALAAPPASAAAVPADLLAGRIVGTVTDAATGEPLIGASARIAGTSIGAATDVEGRFSIASAPSGTQQLVVSYVGYQSDTLAVAVPESGAVEVEVALSSATFDEVVVTAQVAGQLAAINEQFRDATVGNVVSRDRIQELPDNNAAESIGRLPGVSIQRSGGEASRVAIRGLSPKYNNVTVNGVRLPSTDGNERAVDLSLVSSNVLDGIDVRKAITPDLDADAIGGTVNLRLRNAPRGLSVDVLGQGGYTALQDEFGNYKFVGTVSNRLFGDRIGVIATANTERYDRSADKLGIGYAAGTFPRTDSTALRVDNVNAREENVTRSRAGGSLLLDYALPGGRVTGNVFYNSLDNQALNRSQYASFNTLNYAVEDVSNETSILTSALGVEQDLGWLKYDGSVAFTRSRSESPQNNLFTFAEDGTGFAVGSDSLFFIDPVDVGSRIRLDSTIVLSSLWEETSSLDEDQLSVQLNLQTPFRVGEWLTGFFKTGGKLRWLDRGFDINRSGRQGLQYPDANLYACLAEALPQYADVLSAGSLPITSVLLDYDRGDDFLDGQFGLGVVPDEDQLVDVLRGLQGSACASATDDPYEGEYFPDALSSLGRDYSGTEAYQAGYVMGRFEIGRYVTLIPGVRYERDESDYTGQRFRAIQTGIVGGPPQEFTPARGPAHERVLAPHDPPRRPPGRLALGPAGAHGDAGTARLQPVRPDLVDRRLQHDHPGVELAPAAVAGDQLRRLGPGRPRQPRARRRFGLPQDYRRPDPPSPVPHRRRHRGAGGDEHPGGSGTEPRSPSSNRNPVLQTFVNNRRADDFLRVRARVADQLLVLAGRAQGDRAQRQLHPVVLGGDLLLLRLPTGRSSRCLANPRSLHRHLHAR